VWHYHLYVFPRYIDDNLYQNLRSHEIAPPEKRWAYAEQLRTFLASRTEKENTIDGSLLSTKGSTGPLFSLSSQEYLVVPSSMMVARMSTLAHLTIKKQLRNAHALLGLFQRIFGH
jgi:hypothetical protein